MAEYLTRANIRDRVARIIRDNKQVKATMIEELINMVYLDEVMCCDSLYPLYWMLNFDDTLACVGPRTITAISAADPGVITLDDAHGMDTSFLVGVYNIVGTTELNNRIYKVNSTPASNTLSLIDIDSNDAIDTSALTAYSSGGKLVHRGIVLNPTGKMVGDIVSASWHGQGPMEEITHQELEADTKWWKDSTQNPPGRYMHRQRFATDGTETNQLLWFCGAGGAQDLRYWFEERASRMDDDADVPQLPPNRHDAIVAGVALRLIESKVEVENPSVWPVLYKNQIDGIIKLNRKYYQDNPAWQREKPFGL